MNAKTSTELIPSILSFTYLFSDHELDFYLTCEMVNFICHMMRITRYDWI